MVKCDLCQALVCVHCSGAGPGYTHTSEKSPQDGMSVCMVCLEVPRQEWPEEDDDEDSKMDAPEDDGKGGKEADPPSKRRKIGSTYIRLPTEGGNHSIVKRKVAPP